MSGALRRASCAASQVAVNLPSERLGPVLRREVRLELGILDHEPRPEPAHVPVGEPRAVVELEHGTLMRHRLPVKAACHAEVDEQPKAALQSKQQVLAASLDGDHAVALELLGDLEQVVRPREARIEDLRAHDRPPLDPRR